VDPSVVISVPGFSILRYRTRARYGLNLAALRDRQLREGLLGAGDTVGGFAAEVLRTLGATDPARSAEEVLATLEGLMFTTLIRGPRDPGEVEARFRPALGRVLLAQPGVALPGDVARDTFES